jgi:hypothetical protein
MDVEDVTLREVDLSLIMGSSRQVRKTTDKGSVVVFHPKGWEPIVQDGQYAVQMSDFLYEELTQTGRSGYVHAAIPFVLSIQLQG